MRAGQSVMAQKKAARKKSASDSGRTRQARIIAAALSLAAGIGWRHTTLADIADEAGMTLAEVYATFPSKGAILSGFIGQIDEAVLSGDFKDLADEAPRDRLFEVMMRRLDALNPHKAALASILRDNACDPMAVICGRCRVVRSMAWMLEAAGLSSGGLKGCIRVEGLTAIWALTLRTWLRDDTEDMARTMAVLDRQLTRVDRLIACCRRTVRGDGTAAEAA
jgi:AcrR family transcriptional regulator